MARLPRRLSLLFFVAASFILSLVGVVESASLFPTIPTFTPCVNTCIVKNGCILGNFPCMCTAARTSKNTFVSNVVTCMYKECARGIAVDAFLTPMTQGCKLILLPVPDSVIAAAQAQAASIVKTLPPLTTAKPTVNNPPPATTPAPAPVQPPATTPNNPPAATTDKGQQQPPPATTTKAADPKETEDPDPKGGGSVPTEGPDPDPVTSTVSGGVVVIPPIGGRTSTISGSVIRPSPTASGSGGGSGGSGNSGGGGGSTDTATSTAGAARTDPTDSSPFAAPPNAGNAVGASLHLCIALLSVAMVMVIWR